MQNLASVQYLKKQYKSGPVENQMNQTTPYLQYLNLDLSKAVDNLQELIKQENKKYGDWVRSPRFTMGSSPAVMNE